MTNTRMSYDAPRVMDPHMTPDSVLLCNPWVDERAGWKEWTTNDYRTIGIVLAEPPDLEYALFGALTIELYRGTSAGDRIVIAESDATTDTNELHRIFGEPTELCDKIAAALGLLSIEQKTGNPRPRRSIEFH